MGVDNVKCEKCNGTGHNDAFLAMEEYIRALFNDERVQTSDELAQITEFLCGRSGRRDFGHDLGDVWTVIFKMANEAGLKSGWELCNECRGNGEKI